MRRLLKGSIVAVVGIACGGMIATRYNVENNRNSYQNEYQSDETMSPGEINRQGHSIQMNEVEGITDTPGNRGSTDNVYSGRYNSSDYSNQLSNEQGLLGDTNGSSRSRAYRDEYGSGNETKQIRRNRMQGYPSRSNATSSSSSGSATGSVNR